MPCSAGGSEAVSQTSRVHARAAGQETSAGERARGMRARLSSCPVRTLAGEKISCVSTSAESAAINAVPPRAAGEPPAINAAATHRAAEHTAAAATRRERCGVAERDIRPSPEINLINFRICPSLFHNRKELIKRKKMTI